MKTSSVWLVVVLMTAHISNVSGQDALWPVERANPQRTGRSLVRGPNHPQLLWEYEVSSCIENNEPIVDTDGNIYIVIESCTNPALPSCSRIIKLDRQGNDSILLDNIPGGVWSSPALDTDGVLYLCSNNFNHSARDRRVRGISSQGNILWEYRVGRNPLGIVPDDLHNIYFSTFSSDPIDGETFDNHVYSLRGADGAFRWRRNESNTLDLSVPALSQDQQIEYAHAWNGKLFALRRDGSILWVNRETPINGFSHPIVNNNGDIYAFSNTEFVAVESSGGIRWRRAGIFINTSHTSPALLNDGTIIIPSSNPTSIIAINHINGETVWTSELESRPDSLVVDGDDKIYTSIQDKIVCLSLNGKRLWDTITPESITNIVLGDEERIYGRSCRKLYAFGSVTPGVIPVIIIPGIMGTELYDDEVNEKIWIDPNRIAYPKDAYLLRLSLQNDGITPDRRNRCFTDFSWTCRSWLECPLINRCILPDTECCIDGGRRIRVGNYIDIPGAFTAYRSLGEFLINNGYEDQQTLFYFVYDWRLNLEYIAEALRSAIERVAPNSDDGVNIVAHSMGGLLTHAYLKQYPQDHRVNAVIYLGTPHLGAPKAYAVLRWADSIFSSRFLRIILDRKTVAFIAQNCSSVYQLLPRTEFIVDENSKFEDLNISFRSLSNQGHVILAHDFHENIQDFNPVERSFAINGSGQSTPSLFRINSMGDVEVFPDLRGDGTVPRDSSSGFSDTRDCYVNGEHDDLPGIPAVQEKILKILQGREDELVMGIQSIPFEAPELYRWSSLSPITVRFTDIENNITGRDENDDIIEDIPQSQFFVFDHNEAGFLPRDGEYTVDIQALETGRFTLRFETLDVDGDILELFSYQEIPISSEGNGEILLSPSISSPSLLLDVDGNGDTDFTLEPKQVPPPELEEMFVENGDVNKDRGLDISDAIKILGYLFLGEKLECPQAINTNSDGGLDISDAVYLLEFLFLGSENKPEGLIFCE